MPEGSNILDAIAHPATVNLLEDYQGATRTAQGIWNNRLSQSRQAAGQAFQNSLNPDGTTNQPALLQGLKNDPNAAMSAQESAQSGQTLSGEEYAQTQKRMAYGAAGFSQILVDNNGQAPYDAVKSYYDRSVQDGHITAADEAKVMAGFGKDPVANASIGRQRMMQNIQAQEALSRANGAGGTVTGPNGEQLGTRQDSQTHAISVPQQPGAPQGPSPDTVFTAPPAVVPDTRPGALPGTSTTVPRSYPQAPPPVPGNGGYQPPKTAGYKPRGGAAPAPDATPAAPGAAPAAAPAPAPATAPAPQTYLAPPQGQPDTLAADQKAYQAASLASPDQQKRAIAGESALQALQLARTGPGTATESQYKAFLEAHGVSMPPQGTMSSTDYRQVLKKNLLRFAQSSGTGAGTDLQLTSKLESNPNVDEMTNPTNEHVLVQDMGILRRDMAMTKAMPQPAGTGDVLNHIKTFPGNTDPRAFAVDLMQPQERASFFKELAAEPKDGKLHRSLELAHAHGAISLPGSP